MSLGEPKQIVSIGVEGKEDFELDEIALKEIFDAIPSDHRVAIVSVVGAFRTGKSFILDFFLRYLRYSENHSNIKKDNSSSSSSNDDSDNEWMLVGGNTLEGNFNSSLEGTTTTSTSTSSGNKIPSIPLPSDTTTSSLSSTPDLPAPEVSRHHSGFSWRSGSARTTTGIWMWSQPFIVPSPDNPDENIAVIIMDTQGMFDNETGQMLTASIFGLSTLISSFQIYNVDKRIQEDNLQHLSLFAEYGRIALGGSEETERVEKEDTSKIVSDERTYPFQRLDFLVRDWQNFEDEDDVTGCVNEMKTYLDHVLKERAVKDLADTREHINSCFENIGCFILPHPGFKVTKKTYDGSIGDIRPEFRSLLNVYMHKIFEEEVKCKQINGRSVTASELFTFIKAFVKIFREATMFPEAKTLLAATSDANNHNAKDAGCKNYKKTMDDVVGPTGRFIPNEELEQLHASSLTSALELFGEMANIGSEGEKSKYRDILKEDIEEKLVEYTALNESRDPYKAFRFFLVPAVICIVSFILRVISDMSCSGWSDTCASGSDMLSHIYVAICFFMLIVAVTHAYGAYGSIQHLLGGTVSSSKKPKND